MKRVFYFCMTFTLALSVVLASCPFKVSASSIALPFDIPYVFPSDSGWTMDDIATNYDELSEEQKRALNYLVGSNATVYGANRGLSVEGVVDAVQWLGSLGERINTYIFSLPYQALDTNSPLRRNLSNLIDYVSTSVSTTFESWYDSIVRLGHLGTVYNSDYAQGWTDLVGSSSIDSILNWQTETLFASSVSANIFKGVSLPNTVLSAIYSIDSPVMFYGYTEYTYYLGFVSSYDLPFDRILVYTSNGRYYLADSSFNVFNSSSSESFSGVLVMLNKPSMTYDRFYTGDFKFNPRTVSWDFDFDSLPLEIGTLRYVPWDLTYIHYNAFDLPIYITDGEHRPQRLEMTRDLGIFADTSARTVIYNPSVPVAIDALDVEKVITGDYVADSAREYVHSVALSLEDAQATTWNRDAVAVTITNPLADGSGLSIPSTFFNGFTSYIDYLWTFAEPLVLYTRDLLTCLTFDGQGLSWIFFGICSLGVIGGVVYKFLQ